MIDPDEPILPQCKNPDGTYNGVKFFSAITGLSEEEVKRTWDEVKNARKGDRRQNL